MRWLLKSRISTRGPPSGRRGRRASGGRRRGRFGGGSSGPAGGGAADAVEQERDQLVGGDGAVGLEAGVAGGQGERAETAGGDLGLHAEVVGVGGEEVGEGVHV